MKQKIERLRSLGIAGALKAVNYKYFGDYPLSEDQWDAVWTMHSAAEALPDLLSHIDALEARVEEAETIAGIAAIPDVAAMAERLEAAERALAEAVEVLRAAESLKSADVYAGNGKLDDVRKRARAFLTKRGEK